MVICAAGPARTVPHATIRMIAPTPAHTCPHLPTSTCTRIRRVLLLTGASAHVPDCLPASLPRSVFVLFF